MKIIKIKILDEERNYNFVTKTGIILPPVKLTLKNWFGKEKEIKAFPTNCGPTYGGPDVLFIWYCDELGNRLEDYSEQINNYVNSRILYCLEDTLI